MSQLIGADTRRVDAIAEGLHGYSQDVQDLRTMAERAVIEMRNAWSGGDFEHIAHRWEQEAGPRLAEAASALSTMVVALRAQSAEQRRVSGYAENAGVAGNAMKARFPLRSGPPVGAGAARGDPWLGGGVTSGGGGQPRTNGFDADASLLSVGGGSDNFQYELSVGKVEATVVQLLPQVPRSPMGLALTQTSMRSCQRPRSAWRWTSGQRSVSGPASSSTSVSTHRRSSPASIMPLHQSQTDA